MSGAALSEQMNTLLSRFIDTFEIDGHHAYRCLQEYESQRESVCADNNDPVMLMARACMLFGNKRYTESLYDVRRVESLFGPHDNDLHYDSLCVLKVMCLHALGRDTHAFEAAQSYLNTCGDHGRQPLISLCLRICQVQGMFEELYILLDGLMHESSDELSRARFRLLKAVAECEQTGDHERLCAGISSFYWHARGDISPANPLREVVDLYGAHLAYSYAWQGRIDLAESILEDIVVPQQSHPRLTRACAHALTFAAEQRYDESLDLVRDDAIRLVGVSLDEAFMASAIRLVIMHLSGRKREALPLAVRLSDYGRSHPTLSYSVTARLLLCSTFLWMFDFGQAQKMLTRLESDVDVNTLRPFEYAVYACICALIAMRDNDQAACTRIIAKAARDIADPSSSYILASLCAAHPHLLGLIVSEIGVDGLPSNLIDLLDHTRFREQLTASITLLDKNQAALLQQRFSRVEGGIEIDIDEPYKPVNIQLFGGLEISVEGQLIDVATWRRSKSHQLFLKTVLENGSEVPRDMTLTLLWPDMTKKTAANNYYVTLSKMDSYLNKQCDWDREADIITRAACGKIKLNCTLCSTDTAQFESAVLRARKKVLEHDFQSALKHYYRMVELYRGDLLVGDYEYEWLESPRERYRKQFLDSMATAGRICLELGQPHETHFFVDAALHQQAGKETFYQLSLQAYKATGRREDALNAYYECVQYLQDTLGLDPSPELRHLFNELLAS